MAAPHKKQPRPRWRGFSFALHRHGAGLLFCPATIQPHTSVYRVFCRVNAIYTAHTAKPHTGLCSGFSCYLPHSTAADTRPIQSAIIPPAPRWSVSQRRNTSSTYQIPPPRMDASQVSTAAYYNKVYIRVQGAPPRYGSMPDGAAYRRPCKPGGVSSYRVGIRWQVLTRCQQYRPGAPAEWSASPPVQGQPNSLQYGTG